jgi:hypothetical protein
MADANIKKVTIKKSSLPPIDHDSQKYNIRYRIVSEDKNRNSHWQIPILAKFLKLKTLLLQFGQNKK